MIIFLLVKHKLIKILLWKIKIDFLTFIFYYCLHQNYYPKCYHSNFQISLPHQNYQTNFSLNQILF